MDWAPILAYVRGTVDHDLLVRNEYLADNMGRGSGQFLPSERCVQLRWCNKA